MNDIIVDCSVAPFAAAGRVASGTLWALRPHCPGWADTWSCLGHPSCRTLG